jgi:HSP20 family protein
MEVCMSSLIRCETPAVSLSSLVDELFGNSVFNKWGRQLQSTHYPEVDISEEPDHYRIKADVPGMNKEDIKISVENGILSISGEKKDERSENKSGTYHHFERSYGSFLRSFKLPDNVDDTSIDASYKNGVLEVALRKNEKAKPRSIEVRVE